MVLSYIYVQQHMMNCCMYHVIYIYCVSPRAGMFASSKLFSPHAGTFCSSRLLAILYLPMVRHTFFLIGSNLCRPIYKTRHASDRAWIDRFCTIHMHRIELESTDLQNKTHASDRAWIDWWIRSATSVAVAHRYYDMMFLLFYNDSVNDNMYIRNQILSLFGYCGVSNYIWFNCFIGVAKMWYYVTRSILQLICYMI
jgi:hypothetical protein